MMLGAIMNLWPEKCSGIVMEPQQWMVIERAYD